MVSNLLDHESVTTTKCYAEVMLDERTEAINRIEAVLATWFDTISQDKYSPEASKFNFFMSFCWI
jgi:hypothetical protein